MFSSLMDSPRQCQHPELEIGKSGETACPHANRLIAPSSVMRISTTQMSAYFVANLFRMVEGHGGTLGGALFYGMLLVMCYDAMML